ncbi:hypothetical protein LN736_15155 [Clostridium sp. WLY-B-L2]|uniref:Uncharacterized protein n=1 Tax=Clostridium aromativorans TaxID=2836848 RepID=A0ABS8N8Q5_9CLOT|nr:MULTISPECIES: hypothetical protein [Clostridium]MCC9296196.1 hypothetical protein [Clostridium aromativorans]
MEKEKPKKKKLNKNESGRGKDLSFCDIEKLMRHDCYRRVKGAIRRVR